MYVVTGIASGCPRTFKAFEVYRNHVYDRHTDSESMIVHVDDESDECQESASPMESELGDVYRPVSPLIRALVY